MDASGSVDHLRIRMGWIFRVALPIRRWHGFGRKQSSLDVGNTLDFLLDSSFGSVLSDTGSAFRSEQTMPKRPPSFAAGKVLR